MYNYIIYKAENQITGEVYVGATTQSLETRKQDHIQKGTTGTSGYFYQAIGTYGADAFVWNELDTANSVNELAAKESNYIERYKSYTNGYNSNRGGGFKKTVYQFDIETGKLISVYEDLLSAANAVNANKRSISSACLSINKSCKGYYWSYNDTINPISDRRFKKVIQCNLEGKIISVYDSATAAAKDTGLSKTCITRCCREERDKSGGFLWKYA